MILAAVTVALAIACGPTTSSVERSDARDESHSSHAHAAAPTSDELESTLYRGVYDEPVQLQDGYWEGEPFVEGGAARKSVTLAPYFRLSGDIDGDSTDEAVALLTESSGGTGSFVYLAAVTRKGGAPVNVGTALVGDRVQIRRSRVEGGRVILDVVQQGPDDAACCPSQKATRSWTLGPEGLEEQPVEFKGTLSLEDLGGTEWVLRSWTWTEEAPAEPEVTLTYLDGRLAGSGGCNRYFADVKPGALPGELEIGNIGATKMACPPPMMEVEDRFFAALAGARSFRFLAGRLALTFVGENGGINTMLFEERAPEPADEP